MGALHLEPRMAGEAACRPLLAEAAEQRARHLATRPDDARTRHRRIVQLTELASGHMRRLQLPLVQPVLVVQVALAVVEERIAVEVRAARLVEVQTVWAASTSGEVQTFWALRVSCCLPADPKLVPPRQHVPSRLGASSSLSV